MRRKLYILMLFMTAALLLGGCTMNTVEEMYALPKRSEEFNQLQTAIDKAMTGLTYSAPISGENQQTVQMADLDGDNEDEYLVFAASESERPLQVLIFDTDLNGVFRLAEVIESNGSAFEQVEYVAFDDKPGCELVIGRQVSDQVLRSVSVYTFSDGCAEQLFMVGYSKFLTCDLNSDGRSEVMVLRPGESESERGMAVLYSSQNGVIGRSVETELSEEPGHIRRITSGRLHGGTPAVFVASSAEEGAIVTDIFALKDGVFTNVSFSSELETSIQTLRNFYVYAEDIDGDGIMELPGKAAMRPISPWKDSDQKFLLRWFAMDTYGREVDKVFTFHYFLGGWYMQLSGDWGGWVTVEQGDGVFTFYIWDKTYQEATALFSVYVLTGANREEEAVSEGRFALHRTEGVAYAAKLEQGAALYGITEKYLTEHFRMIRQDRRTGEA